MLRCNEVTRLYASEGLRRAPWRKRIAVRFHLMMCRSCQRYVKELTSIGDAVRGAAREDPADPERLEALIQGVLPKAPPPRV
jgi:hypothetical protein